MKAILIKYLNETISEAELQSLKAWLEKPENRETFKNYLRINYTLNKSYLPVDTEKAFQRILDQMNGPNVSKKVRTIKLVPNWLKYAAVFVGISLIGVGLYTSSKKKTDQVVDNQQITLELEDGSIQIVNENRNAQIVDPSGKTVSQQKGNTLIYSDTKTPSYQPSKNPGNNSLVVPFGKTFGLALSDGTQVTLNAGSRLTYPTHFNESKKRSVILNGEAYFEVAENTEHPFIVNTDDMEIEVLGTRFNVTSYTDDEKTYTVLVEGKVAAHNKAMEEDSIILSPNERAYFENGRLQLETVNIGKYVDWVSGRLIFIDDSFAVISNKLERQFDLKIVNKYPALNDITITATFKNKDIHQILETFQKYTPFDYGIKDKTVTITEPKK